MAKAEEFVSPANLWGKPLPGATSKAPKEKKEDKGTRMRAKEYDDEDVDADVDAELEEDVVDDAEAYAEEDTDYEDESSDDVRETAATLPDDEVDDSEDDDETEYDPEEGDEVSDEAVDSAVEADEDDDPVEAPEATKTRKGKVKDMAEKKSGADHIREEIERRQESGDSLRGVDIVAALAKKRVTVSPAQVSQLLKKAGVASGKRTPVAVGEERTRDAARHKRKEEPAKNAAPKRPVARGPSGSATLPMNQLKAATAFLAACDGCYETASEILAEHKQLRSAMAT